MTTVNLNREAIGNALLALFNRNGVFRTVSRQIKMWGDTPQAERPSLMLAEHGEEYVREGQGQPPYVTLEYMAYVYTWGKNVSNPITLLNPLIDAMDAALADHPVTGAPQTLGGLVAHVWIEGKIIKDPGDLDGDGLAMIPIKALIPAFSS